MPREYVKGGPLKLGTRIVKAFVDEETRNKLYRLAKRDLRTVTGEIAFLIHKEPE